MLELRPTCEHCNRLLPAATTDAMICSYECTFCRSCALDLLANVCPNCGGGFTQRPVRPRANLRGGNYLGNHPATERKVHKPVDIQAHRVFAAAIMETPAEER